MEMICPRGFAPLAALSSITAPVQGAACCQGLGGYSGSTRATEGAQKPSPAFNPIPVQPGCPSPPTCPASTAMLAAALLKTWSHQWKVKGSAASCPTCGVQRSCRDGCGGQRAAGQAREGIHTHPRRVALHLHPDGLGDAVLPPAQPLPCRRGTVTPARPGSTGGWGAAGPRGSG